MVESSNSLKAARAEVENMQELKLPFRIASVVLPPC